MLTLLLPGTTPVYYGEEIGMDNIQVKYDDIQSLSAKNNPVCIKKCPNLSWILFNDNVFFVGEDPNYKFVTRYCYSPSRPK